MTDKATLLALAERVEAATGPDREVDAEIALALGIVRERDGNVFFGHTDYSCMVLERSYYDIEGSAPELPSYTASLDAAMTLVPEGFWQELKGPRRYLNIPTNSPNFWSAYLSSYNHEGDVMGWAATPALALCAAAICARAGIQS